MGGGGGMERPYGAVNYETLGICDFIEGINHCHKIFSWCDFNDVPWFIREG